MGPLMILWLAAGTVPAPGAAVFEGVCAPVAPAGAVPLLDGCGGRREPGAPLRLVARRDDARLGKAHYLGWGIADWVIAGSMWAGAAYLGVAGSLLLVSANTGEGRAVGALLVGGGVGLGLGGAVVAQHAAANIETYRRLRGY
jgi:hypothetical protein